MVRLTGPLDVSRTQVRNTQGVSEVAPDGTAAAVNQVSRATLAILNQARDQQIENDVAKVEIATRRRLDALRAEVDQDPDNSTLAQRWDEGAQRIIAEGATQLRSPAHQQLWRERSQGAIETERRGIIALQQQRVVESARAGLIENVSSAQAILTDENSTPAARANALQVIEAAVSQAAQRHVIGADDAARMRAQARAAQTEFEQTQGMRARAQALEDQIYTEAGGYSNALAQARAITEPGLRDMVVERLEARYAQVERARQESTRSAMEDAFTRIERGDLLDTIPSGTRAVLIAQGRWDDMRTYARQRAANLGNGGILASESEAVADRLMADAVTSDGARNFANMDLAPYMTQMNPDDRARVQRYQSYLRGETPLTDGGDTLIERSYHDIHAAAVIEAERAGMDVTGAGNNGNNLARRGQFNAFVMAATRRFVDENRRPPTAAEAQELGRTAMLRVNGAGNTRYLFQTHTIQSGDNSGAPRVRVHFAQIPQWEVDRIVRQWRAAHDGENPTQGDVEMAYSIQLAEDNR